MDYSLIHPRYGRHEPQRVKPNHTLVLLQDTDTVARVWNNDLCAGIESRNIFEVLYVLAQYQQPAQVMFISSGGEE